MLTIGSSKLEKVKEVFDGKEYEGVKFEVVSKRLSSYVVKHNAESDDTAKSIAKRAAKASGYFDTLFCSVQVLNDKLYAGK